MTCDTEALRNPLSPASHVNFTRIATIDLYYIRNAHKGKGQRFDNSIIYYNISIKSHIPSIFEMANSVQVMWLLSLICPILYLILASLNPEIVPKARLTIIVLLSTIVNFCLWAFWQIFIYPSFFSPLRHLPRPKVCK